jgi:RNA polymerase sigma factor (sigma-70 family)
VAPSDERDDAALVLAVREGDPEAFGVLFDRWFDRVYDVARNIVRDPDTAADVAQDTFISAWERLDRLDRIESFGGWLLRIARNRALDVLERQGRSSTQASETVTGLHDHGLPDLVGSRRELDVAEISATRDRDALLRAATVALGERDASILDLHLRHGLSPAEIADELGITPNNAHQLLFRMRNKLGEAVGAVVLWRRGNPACDELAALVMAADANHTIVSSTFDRPTFEMIERHRKTCATCTERRAALLAPEQLFSAAPILSVPLLLRARVLDHLRDAGVPVDGAATPAVDSFDDTTNTAGDSATEPSTSSTRAHPPSTDPRDDPGSPADEPATVRDTRRRRVVVALLAAAATLTILAAGVIALDDGNDSATKAFEATTIATPSTLLRSGQPRSGPGGLTASTSRPADRTSSTEPGLAAATTSTSPEPIVVPPVTGPPTTTRTVVTSPPLTPTPPSPTPVPTNPVPTTTAPPPPTTVPPAAPPPTTLPPPAPPDIIRLFLGTPPGGLICAVPSQSPRRLEWTSTGATSAQLVIAGTTRTVNPTGRVDACAASGAVATLTITGPGGTDSANLPVP